VRKEIRVLSRTMSRDNPLWGAPRIHNELLKHGIDIGETSVRVSTQFAIGDHRHKPGGLPGEPRKECGFRRLLHRADDPVSDILYLPVLADERQRILHFAVTAHLRRVDGVGIARSFFPGRPRHAICYVIATRSSERIL
jgi:hypothetical protein